MVRGGCTSSRASGQVWRYGVWGAGWLAARRMGVSSHDGIDACWVRTGQSYVPGAERSGIEAWACLPVLPPCKLPYLDRAQPSPLKGSRRRKERKTRPLYWSKALCIRYAPACDGGTWPGHVRGFTDGPITDGTGVIPCLTSPYLPSACCLGASWTPSLPTCAQRRDGLYAHATSCALV
jgi:hypothetical protein